MLCADEPQGCPGEMNNYEFCADFVAERARRAAPGAPVAVLDYGCGAGQIVDLVARIGPHVRAYGCDVFYEGGSYRGQVSPELWASGAVREIEGGRIPFDDEAFDIVVNNQVMEHVEDLEAVLAEVARVLKPGGIVLSLFPDRSVWREGHCGIPFLHRFPKGSAARVHYALALRSVGLGHHTVGKTRLQWSRDFCEWLDRWTCYRSYSDIADAFSRHIGPPVHIEERWLERRLGRRAGLASGLPVALRRQAVRKLMGLVFECTKSAPSP